MFQPCGNLELPQDISIGSIAGKRAGQPATREDHDGNEEDTPTNQEG
jgi:hypothetical protein